MAGSATVPQEVFPPEKWPSRKTVARSMGLDRNRLSSSTTASPWMTSTLARRARLRRACCARSGLNSIVYTASNTLLHRYAVPPRYVPVSMNVVLPVVRRAWLIARNFR